MGEIYSEEENTRSEKRGKRKTNSLTVLDSYGTNVSQLAIEGKLDPVIGREEEIKRTIQILGRRKKNNPVLVGEPGVGKCVTGDSEIEIRNKKTGKIERITISEFIKLIDS